MVNGCQSRVMTILRMLGRIAARCGRCARLTGAYSDRADRLKPNIVFSKRDSYQRRGHLTVSKVGSYRLTLPRTRLTNPRTHPERGAVVARSGVRVPGLTRCKAPIRGFPRVCRPAAAARSLRRRCYAHVPVHLCFPPQLFGGARRRQNLEF